MGALRREYLENGFAVVPQILGSSEIALVRAALGAPAFNLCASAGEPIDEASQDSWPGLHEALRRVKAQGDKVYLNATKIAQNDPRILSLAGAPRLLDALAAVGVTQPVVALKPFPVLIADDLHIEGGYNLRPWHQEWPVMQGSHDGLVVWLALHDITPQHNGLELLPGSHRGGKRPYERTKCGTGVVKDHIPQTAPVSPTLKAGDAVLFSTFTMHRTAPTGGALRAAISIRFNNLAAPDFQARHYPDPSRLEIERAPLDGYEPIVKWPD